MLELQVPLLAAKALILLLLFAFIYAVMSRSIGDLRKIPDDSPYVPGRGHNGRARRVSASGVPGLVVEDSEILAPETRFELGDGDTSMGRSSGSNIVLRSDDYASGRHAQLTRHGGLLYIEDLGSTNGTFVNGRKTVGATPLRNGDTVRVGSTTFRYEE
jgi:pSer/pThr/pTyr-binding forkhead associated (FHA) protein